MAPFFLNLGIRWRCGQFYATGTLLPERELTNI